MRDLLYFFLVGIGTGALYAMLGTGIVVAFRGSGVINFAHGAMAMFSMFVFVELRTKGDLVLPWFDVLPGDVNLPVRISLLDEPMRFAPSLALMLGMAVLLGLIVHFLVFRPLRHAAPLGKVIGSIGILLYLQGVALLNFGEAARQLSAIFPDSPWENFLGLGRAFRQDALWVAVAAIAIGVGLWAFFKFTRVGLATRAAAGNEKGAVLLGYSPEFLAGANWVLASLAAAIAALLAGPIVGSLEPNRYTLFIVPALGAALVGGLRSPVLATFGGLGIGMAQTGIGYLTQQTWFPTWGKTGVVEAIPLVVIAAVLFVRGKGLPVRGTVEEKRLPLSPQPVRVLAHAVIWPIVAVATVLVLDGPWELAFTTSLISAILMLSYVVLTGYVGQISLAQLSLAGVTAFILARLMSSGVAVAGQPFAVDGPGWPMVVALPIAVLGAVAVGLIIAVPALRIRGVQLAVVTIAAALTLENFYFKNPSLTDLAAGSGAPVPKPTLFGLDLSITGSEGLSDRFGFSLFTIVMLTLCAVVVANLRRGTTGRRFLAVRTNERAAAAAGIDVPRTKMLAFGIAAALAGVSGAMFAFQQQNISSANWAVFLGLSFLAFAFLGGITSVNGAIVGGLLGTGGLMAYLGKYHFPRLDEYTVIIGGIGMILTAILNPDGVAPVLQPQLRALGNALVHWRLPEWRAAAVRLGPWIVGGAALGWVIWTRRPGFSWWMVVLAVGLSLFIRSIYMQIRHGTTVLAAPAEVADAQPVVHVPASPLAVADRETGSTGPMRRADGGRPVLLQTTDLTVTFGGLHANDHVSITIEEGAFVGLIGPNGAGKTTFIDAITGFVPTSDGAVAFDDAKITRLSPTDRTHRGLSRTFQSLELFEDLSVIDNLRAAAEPARWYSALEDIVRPRRALTRERQVEWALELVGLEDVRDRLPSGLPHGLRKLIGVARCLASGPKLVLLDEPAAGLDTGESQALGRRLRRLPDEGITVFMIDHDMGLVLSVCDYIYVMDFGKIIASGTPAEIRANDDVITAYLGQTVGDSHLLEEEALLSLGEGETDVLSSVGEWHAGTAEEVRP